METGGHVQQHAKVVVAYPNGRRLKGYVYDFSPARDFFFLFPRDHDATKPNSATQRVAIRMHELKAVFFVKDFDGDPRRYDDETTAADTYRHGRKLEVTFPDGEKIIGISETYHPTKPGFFLFPTNPNSNNDHVWVISARAKVRPIPAGTACLKKAAGSGAQK